ncbi:MAG: hypothetical protein JO131_00495 [Gammaproteobacteria bacterium]|nr:hypothetical protein [Gammaproteobacteria bacterium]
MRSGTDSQAFCTKNLMIAMGTTNTLTHLESPKLSESKHKATQQKVKKKELISPTVPKKISVMQMRPFGAEGGFYSLDFIIIGYLSTEDCLYIMNSVNTKSTVSTNAYSHAITLRLLPLLEYLIKKRRRQDIKHVLQLLKSTVSSTHIKDLTNMDALQLNHKYIALCAEHKPLWAFNINFYMKSNLIDLNHVHKISLHSLIVTYTAKDLAKLLYQAVCHKKFIFLQTLQQVYPCKQLLMLKDFDINAKSELSLLGNIINQFSLSIKGFDIKTKLLISLLYRFPKKYLRNEIKLLEKHAVQSHNAKFMLMYAFEKSNGPPWPYSIAEKGLALTVLSKLIIHVSTISALFAIYDDHIDCAYFNTPDPSSGKFFTTKASKPKSHFIIGLNDRMHKIIESVPAERNLINDEKISQHPIYLYKEPLPRKLNYSHFKLN